VDAHGYVQLTKKGRFREALQLVRDKLPFPGILGYICTHPCELHCKHIDMDSAIRIRDIKRFLAEWEPGEPRHLLAREPQRPDPIAVVGSGPSGLIAAHDLQRRGYRVTLFERKQTIGGCLVHKIPEWRLPRRVVERDLSIIDALQIDLRTGTHVGREIGLEELRKDYPAVLLSCGYDGGVDLLRDGGNELRRSIRDTVWVDPVTCETGMPGIFAGGDAVSGPGTVIQALALGRRCAESVHRYLTGRDLREDREGPLPRRLLWTLEIDEAERRSRERTPVMLQPYDETLSEQEARDEGERCFDCDCKRCVEDCEFLAKHCRSPKDLARRVKDSPADENVLKMVYSCNLCSLCSTVCPEDLDTGALLIEARREAVGRGDGPLPEHKPALRHFRRGVSRSFSLVMPEPGRGRSKRLFFPGCALPAIAPDRTLEIYDELRRQYRSTGVLMYCCGAPVDLLGMEDEFALVRETILCMAESVEAEELITACPDCACTLKARIGELKITTVWELLAEAWQPPRRREGAAVAVHDSCRARGDAGMRAAVRRLLADGGGAVEEIEYAAERARCCGLGGMIDAVDGELTRAIAQRCAGESALPMVTYCAGCRMALAGSGKQAIHILDFLLASDWQDALRARPPGRIGQYANRLRTKWSFKRLRPLGAE
jgi:NADPH-dependent glutamate synthase beta subunit-like oxidoreductase